MKIVGLQIQSYGAMRNFSVSGLPPTGITVIHGPNEAGKSTLLNFIHFTLFDTRDSQYAQCGGALSVLFGDSPRPWIIHRHRHGKKSQISVTRPDNTVGTEVDLSNLLQGTDARLFRSVFAFGLKELQDFDTLSQENIRERIFTAGLVGAAKSPRDVTMEIESHFDSLVRHRGECLARSVCNKLQELGIQLDTSRKNQSRYAEFQAHVNGLSASQNVHETKIEALRKRQSELKVLIEVWPSWEELRSIELEMKNIAPLVNIPPNAETTLVQLRTIVNNNERELAKLKNRKDDLNRQRDALRPNRLLTEKQPIVEALHSQLAVVQERGNHIKKLESERKGEHEKYLDAIREIGPGLNEEQIVQTDVSFSERERVRDWIHKLEDAGAKYAQARAEQENERRLIAVAQDRLKELNKNRLNDSNPRSFERQENELNRLRIALASSAQVKSEALGWERDIQRLESELNEFVVDASFPAWLTLALIAVAIISFSAAVWQVRSNSVTTGILGVAGLVAIGAVIAISNSKKRVLLRNQERRQRISAKLDSARTDANALKARTHQFESVICEAASQLGLQVPVPDEAVHQKELELRSIRERSAKLDQQSDMLERTRQDLLSLQNREKLLTSALNSAETVLRGHEASWLQWKQKRNLPVALKPQSALDLFNFITRAQECVKKRSFIDPQLKKIRGENIEWENNFRTVCQELNVEISNGASLIEKCIELRADCIHAIGIKTSHDSLNVEAANIERDIVEKTEECSLSKKKIGDLLSSVGVNNDDSFCRLLEREGIRQRKSLRRNDLIGQIGGRLGIGQEAERLRHMLATGQCLEWRQNLSQIDSEISHAETNRDQLLREHTSASQKLSELRQSADIASREFEYGTHLADLSRLLREWKVLKLAHSLIERTMQDCEQNRQPQILQDAQRWFAPITGGRFTRLLRDERNEAIQVMNSEQQTLTLDQLSRGTAEQLYLSLRLGLVQEFSRQRERLPLIFDDILVNFDPKRARRVVECLNELSTKHGQQIFLFTCHPQIRDLICEVCPNCRVEELSECDLASQ